MSLPEPGRLRLLVSMFWGSILSLVEEEEEEEKGEDGEEEEEKN